MAPHILRQPARDILRSLAAKLVLPRKRREENAAEFHTAIAAQWLKCVADGIPTPTYWWTADMLRWHREVQQLTPEPDDAKRQEHLRRTKLLSAEQSRSTLLKEARDHIPQDEQKDAKSASSLEKKTEEKPRSEWWKRSGLTLHPKVPEWCVRVAQQGQATMAVSALRPLPPRAPRST